MSHRAVRLLLEDVAESLADNVHFGYGRGSDFNQIRKKAQRGIWLDPLGKSPRFADNDTSDYTSAWSVQMLFWSQDSEDSIETDYQLLLDWASDMGDKFLNKLNRFVEDQPETADLSSTTIVISGVSFQPAIKVTADILTGYIVTFSLTTPDTFDYCSIYAS